ncbi:unnamed protein product [Pocillopora meandrina]|uniref:Maturase K n=1 Tax=Pocillopora meandrina TaxID=46732 RepID=A0AAU9X2X6_9CNID|nr:unnamed protein product [Pocillopora meandrina]
MLNFFNETLIYHWSHHKRGWHSFLLESLFRFYLRAPYREDGLSYFHEGQRNQEPVITALSSHNSSHQCQLYMHNVKSTKLLNHRSKLNSPKLAEESHMMEDNNHSSGDFGDPAPERNFYYAVQVIGFCEK